MKKLTAALLALVLLLSFACAEEPPDPLTAYRAQMGFSAANPGTTQLSILVHDAASWRAGVTDRPTEFYLNIQPPKALVGERHLDIIEAVKRWNILSTGLSVNFQGQRHQLVVSDHGVKGIRCFDLLHAAGPDYDALRDQAAQVLGYYPGDMNFRGKQSVQATLEWRGGSAGGSVCITAPDALRALDALINASVPTAGPAPGAFNAFLIVRYVDGSEADFALATEEAGAGFYRGMSFRYGDPAQLLALFGLADESFSSLTKGENANV